jgi:nucleotide-binding universal stress UspA family protein
MSAGYGTIAVCVDESEASLGALAEARRLLSEGGRLMVVHVLSSAEMAVFPSPVLALPPGETPEHAREMLGRLVRADAGEEGVLLAGENAPAAVCDWAAREGRPDLLVAAAHRGGWARALLGGFATHLAYHAPCPVLLTRPLAYDLPTEAG